MKNIFNSFSSPRPLRDSLRPLRETGLSRRWAVLAAAILFNVGSATAAEPGRVDFARQIRPILAESCFECHGPDPKGRKGDLRLDSRDDVFADRGGYRLVVPGNPEESELVARI